MNKIIKAFGDGTFSSEYLKKSDAAAYDYTLKGINNFIHKIELMTEKINLSLFKDFFESSSLADYAKMLINVKDSNKNKEIVTKIKDRISDVKDRIKEMSEKEKKKSTNGTLKIIEDIPDYNKVAQHFLFGCIRS